MKAETYALLAALLWGLAPVIEKIGLRGMDPMTATLIRSLAAVAFLAVVCLAVGRSQVGGMKYVGYMIVGGILAGGLGLYLYYPCTQLWAGVQGRAVVEHVSAVRDTVFHPGPEGTA